MIELNDVNGASIYTAQITKQLLEEFKEPLIGCEMGVPYGGAIERIATLWKNRGVIYGFDTFTGHPKEIADICENTIQNGGKESEAAKCMDTWYENIGTNQTTYDYIRNELDQQGLSNAILIKGLITDKTNIPFEHLHYCMLDLDFPLSMRQAYNLIKNKMVSGSYLCLHDVLEKSWIPGVNEVYQEILNEGFFEIYKEIPDSFLAILKKK